MINKNINYQELYQYEIFPKIADYESLRKKTAIAIKCAKFIGSLLILSPFLLWAALFFIDSRLYEFFANYGIDPLMLPIYVLITTPILGLVGFLIEHQKKAAKNHIEKILFNEISPSLKNIFENFASSSNKKIIKDSEINQHYYSRETINGFYGKYKGVNFRISKDLTYYRNKSKPYQSICIIFENLPAIKYIKPDKLKIINFKNSINTKTSYHMGKLLICYDFKQRENLLEFFNTNITLMDSRQFTKFCEEIKSLYDFIDSIDKDLKTKITSLINVNLAR